MTHRTNASYAEAHKTEEGIATKKKLSGEKAILKYDTINPHLISWLKVTSQTHTGKNITRW
jgi:hypothetical protein